MRNSGVGSKLLAAVSEWARELELEMLIVWPSDASIPFYRRAGFDPTSEMLEKDIARYEG
jgi:N-acetylglutamate synthase-like GNAT family acetyltransferase